MSATLTPERRKVWKDRLGWPVVFFKDRPILNAIRWLLHARSYGEFHYEPRPPDGSVDCGTLQPDGEK